MTFVLVSMAGITTPVFPERETRLFSQNMAMGGQSSNPVSLMGVLPRFRAMARPSPWCPNLDNPMSETHQCLRKRTFHSSLPPGQPSTILACKVSF